MIIQALPHYPVPAGGGTWTPAALPSLDGWYDADQQTEANGARVTSFLDRSGNAYHFVEVAASGPTMRTNFVNGKKALESGGTASPARLEGPFLLYENDPSATMMYVFKGRADPSVSPGDQSPFGGNNNGGNCHLFTDSLWYENFASSTRRSVNPPTSWASWRIAGVTSATNDFKMYWDGTQILSSGTNTVETTATARSMFDQNAGIAGYFNGYLAEVIFCSTSLGTADRQKMEGYLAHKYGLTANLPVGHPYITNAP